MIKFAAVFWILFSTAALFAQDTTRVAASADSLPGQSKPSGELQGPIKYWADHIYLSDGGNFIYLRGSAKLIYQDMTLTAADIMIDQRKKTLYATGNLDSIDAEGHAALRGTPVFTEAGQEPLKGDSIEYNFDTQRGRIQMGTTKMEPGFYRGKYIHRIADSTLLVQDGIFTSCEYIDHPHYYFKSSRIRLKVKDKVIARPIVFYIADVPLAWLPFGVFPNKRGRHSGIVIPKYGESTVGGRFLRGMGYYWAPNDYFDASFLMDYYDKLDFAYRIRARYIVRYKLNGAFSAEYFPRDLSTGQKTERWRLTFSHRQTIDPTMSISGQGSFMSDRNFVRQLSPNLEDRLNQNITSNISISKRWPGTKNSLSFSASHNQNLQTGRISYTLPSLSFNRAQSTLYETVTGKKLGGRRNWYQNIYFSYNSQLVHRGDKVPTSDSTFQATQTQGVQHRFSFSAPNKVFKYLNLSPSLSLQEVWVDEITEAKLNADSNSIEEFQKKQFAARHTFSASLAAKTTLYGLFEPNIGKLKYIRHKIDPSISYTYRPNFSSPFYGYFNEITDTNGVVHKIDRFKNNPFGGTGSSESQSINIRLGNVFEGKLIDENNKEKKISLLTMNFGTSYNFTKDSLRWNQLSTNLRSNILGKNISVRMTHSFYKRNHANTGYINQFNSFPQLVSLSTSYSFSISDKTFAKKKKKKTPSEKATADSLQNEGILKNPTYRSPYINYRDQTRKISSPWSTSFSLSYSYNRWRTDPHRLDLSARANFKLSKNWKIGWNAYFDLVNKRITTQRFNIYRDLHCWEMSFGWQPSIGYYDFQINIKASALQDIKLTKHPTGSGRVYY